MVTTSNIDFHMQYNQRVEKEVVLIEFGHWYEIPTFYKFLHDEVIKQNLTPIFFTYDDIPVSVYQLWPFFDENKVFILKKFQDIKHFVKYIKNRTVKTFFLKTPQRYINLSLIEFFAKKGTRCYTIITSSLGYKTYDNYFAVENQSIAQKDEKTAVKYVSVIKLLKDIRYRLSIELTRFTPLMFSLPLPKSYLISSIGNYHQYVIKNKSTYLVPTAEEVLILKKTFPNQSVERYTHPFVHKSKLVKFEKSHYLFFLNLIESSFNVKLYLDYITEKLLSENVSSDDKIIFQFHPRQSLVIINTFTRILQSNFKKSSFGNNEGFHNLESILKKGKLMFSPVSTAVRLAYFYRPDLRIIIYDPFYPEESKNALAGTPYGPIVEEVVETHNLKEFII